MVLGNASLAIYPMFSEANASATEEVMMLHNPN